MIKLNSQAIWNHHKNLKDSNLHNLYNKIALLKKTIPFCLPSYHCTDKYLRIRAMSLALFLLFVAVSHGAADSKYTVYFYSPEANINSFRSLKIEFDTYLSGFGSYQFQPFNDGKTFEKFIDGKTDGVFLISSWHYKNLKVHVPLEPVLVGISKGRLSQKRVLAGKQTRENLASLKGQTLASAGSREYTQNLLRQMLGEEQTELVESLKILTVPKDIDALMAVGFGMAQSALTMESSLAKLSVLNPKQYQRLNRLATSEEILFPIIAAPKQSDDKIKTLLAVIEEMGTRPEGRQKLKMLGLDLTFRT